MKNALGFTDFQWGTFHLDEESVCRTSGFPVSTAHLKKMADHDDHLAHTEPLANRFVSAIAVHSSALLVYDKFR
jgi:hypothetical protein